MQFIRRLIGTLRSECLLVVSACRSSACLASKTILLLGLAYQLGPADLGSRRLPEFDWTDKALVAVAALILARLLVPANFGAGIARAGDWADDRSTRPLSFWVAGLRSAVLTQRLTATRSLRRFSGHMRRIPGDLRARITAFCGRRGVGDRLFALLGYRLWWCVRGPFTRVCRQERPLVVIGGAARSGTTLLRTMLGRHPMIASLPETTVFLRRISSPADLAERLGWRPELIGSLQRESVSQADFIRRFHQAVLVHSGKHLWVEKTPKNVFRFRFIRRHFPHASLVHIVRDGRDAVSSLRRTPFAKLDHAAWDSVAAARRCGVQWRNSVRAGLRLRGDPAYYELRYEDLVHDPEPVLRRLLAFLELPWDDRVLLQGEAESHDADALLVAGAVFDASVRRWQRDLSPADERALQPLIGPLLVELGYAENLQWHTIPPAADRGAHADQAPARAR